jgi:hypothetical protein
MAADAQEAEAVVISAEEIERKQSAAAVLLAEAEVRRMRAKEFGDPDGAETVRLLARAAQILLVDLLLEETVEYDVGGA